MVHDRRFAKPSIINLSTDIAEIWPQFLPRKKSSFPQFWSWSGFGEVKDKKQKHQVKKQSKKIRPAVTTYRWLNK